jgi:hypothetical protein
MKTAGKKKEQKKDRRKPGPIANPNLVPTTVSLDSQMVEWGKKQPGGLSALLRRLMLEEYKRQGA